MHTKTDSHNNLSPILMSEKTDINQKSLIDFAGSLDEKEENVMLSVINDKDSKDINMQL